MADSTPLSSYEQQRLDNIASNEAQLLALGLTSILPKQPNSQPRSKRPKRVPQQTSVPERRSSRVQGGAAPNIYIDTEAPGGAVTVGGNWHALADQREREAMLSAERAALKDPLTRFGFGEPPETEEHLLEGAERKAFAALYKVKRAKAQELKIEGYKIAQHRSLCDVVRENPADAASLSTCWGFGGSGVRLQKYGDMFLSALAPHAAKVSAQQQAERPEAERRAAAARAGAEAPAAVPAKRSLAAAGDEDGAEEDDDAPLSKRRKRASGGGGGGGGGGGHMNGSASDAWDKVLASMPEAEAEAEAEEDPLAVMPEKAEHLLPAEREAYDALVAATHVRAEALGERWVWSVAMSRAQVSAWCHSQRPPRASFRRVWLAPHTKEAPLIGSPSERLGRCSQAMPKSPILRAPHRGTHLTLLCFTRNIAMSRSLCEMTRRLPASLPQLRACWGFGGSGVRAERHGDFLLDALRPHLPSLRAAHAAAARGDIAPDIELVAAEPHGGGQAKVTAKAKSEMVVKQDDVSSDDDDAEEAAAAEEEAEEEEEAVPLARRPRPRHAAHVAPAVSAKAAPASKKPAPERRRTRVSS